MTTKITVIGLLMLNGVAWSQTSITIPNYSFEGLSGSLSSPTIGTTTGSMGAWNMAAGTTISILGVGASVGINPIGIGAPDGTNVIQMQIPVGLGVNGSVSISQMLTTAFIPNTIYTLSFYLNPGTSVSALNSTSVGLKSGATTVDSLSSGTLTGLLNPNTYSLVTLTYTNTSYTGDIGIDLNMSGIAGLATHSYADDFQMTQTPLVVSPTPEPSVLALGVLGGWGCLITLRRKY